MYFAFILFLKWKPKPKPLFWKCVLKDVSLAKHSRKGDNHWRIFSFFFFILSVSQSPSEESRHKYSTFKNFPQEFWISKPVCLEESSWKVTNTCSWTGNVIESKKQINTFFCVSAKFSFQKDFLFLLFWWGNGKLYCCYMIFFPLSV